VRTIPFVDAHVHLWDLDRLRYPWLTPPFGADGPARSVEAIAQTYLPTHYQQKSAGWRVAAYVHVDAGAAPEDAPAETEWLSGLDDGLAGIVAFAQLDAPDVARQFAVQRANYRVRGIRQIVNWHPDPTRSHTPRDLTRDEGWALGFLEKPTIGPGNQAPMRGIIENSQRGARRPLSIIVNSPGAGCRISCLNISTAAHTPR
jgi:hypothetical protein